MTFYNENEYINSLTRFLPLGTQSALGVFFVKDGEETEVSALPFDLNTPNGGETQINENVERDLSSLALSLCVAKMNEGKLGRDVTVGVVAIAEDLTNASKIAKIIANVFEENLSYVGFIIGFDHFRWENSKTAEFGFLEETTGDSE